MRIRHATALAATVTLAACTPSVSPPADTTSDTPSATYQVSVRTEHPCPGDYPIEAVCGDELDLAADGTWVARDLSSGHTASGQTDPDTVTTAAAIVIDHHAALTRIPAEGCPARIRSVTVHATPADNGDTTTYELSPCTSDLELGGGRTISDFDDTVADVLADARDALATSAI